MPSALRSLHIFPKLIGTRFRVQPCRWTEKAASLIVKETV
jgi:hypothetical protein